MRTLENLKKPDKERTLAAFRGEIPDRVPTFEVCIEERNVEAILGRECGSTLAGSRGAKDSSYFADPMDPVDYAEICAAVGQDFMGFESLWAPFKYKDDKGDIHLITDGRIKTFEDYEKAIPPCWELDFAPRKKFLDMYVKEAKKHNLGVFLLTGCLFRSCYQYLCGFSDFFEMCYIEEELVNKVLDDVAKFYRDTVILALEAGIDMLYIADDIAYKSGTFINPTKMKELWFPKFKSIMQPAISAGLPIMFHSCGNLNAIFDDMVMNLEVQCVNPIEPYSMDIFEIKRKYGDKICIAGNVDIAGPLAFGTPEDVDKLVKDMVEPLKQGGRYVLSTCHSITIDIPPENYRAMLDANLKYGLY